MTVSKLSQSGAAYKVQVFTYLVYESKHVESYEAATGICSVRRTIGTLEPLEL